MLFHPTPLKGAYTIDLEKKGDERGFLARFFCMKEFEKMGLDTQFVQINNSMSAVSGTLRGFHYQLAPYQETKVVRCLQGALYDVIIDIRPQSETFGKSFGALLSSQNRKMMYVPRGFAHAILTLEPNTEILYLVSQYYTPEYERGIRWNDPAFNIEWPIEPEVISGKDKNHPDFNPSWHLSRQEAGV